MSKRPKAQSTSDEDYIPSGHEQGGSDEGESDGDRYEGSVRGGTPPRSPTYEVPIHSNPSSHPPISIRVSIPPVPPVVSSQPASTIPIPTPIFSKATTTTPTTTEPEVRANISDMGVRTSEPEHPITYQPLLPTPSTETTKVLGGEDVDFDSVYFVHTEFRVTKMMMLQSQRGISRI